jgi:hypothetical protein
MIPHCRVAKGLDLYLRALYLSARVRHVLTFSRIKLITSVLYSVCMVMKCLSVLLIWRTATLELHIKHSCY